MNHKINHLIAGLACFGLANWAGAAGIITLSDGINPAITVADGSPADLNTNTSVVGVNTNIGVWSVVILNGLTKPAFGSAASPQMDIDILATSTGAGNLTVIFSDQNFGPDSGILNADIIGQPSQPGAPATVSYTVYGDAGNANRLASLLANTGTNTLSGPIFGANSGPIALTAPYSLSQVVTISASGAGGFSVDASLNVLSLACAGGSGVVGAPYSSALVASGGCLQNPGYTNFAIISGALPPGLTLNPLTGAISGTPTNAGTYPYEAEVTDGCGNVANTSAENCGITITTTNLPYANCEYVNVHQNQPITPVTLTGSGGCGGPYTFTAQGLPAGLVISSTGTISGTTSATGTFEYIVIVTDSCGSKGTNTCLVLGKNPCPCGL